MRSPAQIEASRSNGRRSHGPITEQGKRKSSQNAIRHGLLAASIVCQSENKSSFLAMLNALMDEHQPSTETQHMLVETMAATRWRLIRNWEMQRQAFEWDAENNDGRNPQERVIHGMATSGPLHRQQLLLRYEVALERQFHKALRELQRLQSQPTPPAKRTQELIEKEETPLAQPVEILPGRSAAAQSSAAPGLIAAIHPDGKAQSAPAAANNHPPKCYLTDPSARLHTYVREP